MDDGCLPLFLLPNHLAVLCGILALPSVNFHCALDRRVKMMTYRNASLDN